MVSAGGSTILWVTTANGSMPRAVATARARRCGPWPKCLPAPCLTVTAPLARELIDTVLPTLADLRSLRAQAYVIMAWGHLWASGVEDIEPLEAVAWSAARRLAECYRRASRPDWQWFESRMTYANAVLPHALLIAAKRWPEETFLDIARTSFAFLDQHTTVETESIGCPVFWPIGNEGWFPRGDEKAPYDQQPVEAVTMAEAALVAFDLLGGEEYLAVFRRAHGWFLGRNSLKLAVADVRTGGCCDGLHASGLNHNQGAESTFAWLWTEMSREQGAGSREPDLSLPARRSPLLLTPCSPLPASRYRKLLFMETNLLRESPPLGLYPELFRRHEANPILTAGDWPYPAHTVFNAGACQVGDETILLVRVEDRRGHSHLTVARSDDGVSNWRINPKPSFAADPAHLSEEAWGVEDPRLTWIEERGQWIIAYTAYSSSGPLVSLAETKDFISFKRLDRSCRPTTKTRRFFPAASATVTR